MRGREGKSPWPARRSRRSRERRSSRSRSRTSSTPSSGSSPFLSPSERRRSGARHARGRSRRARGRAQVGLVLVVTRDPAVEALARRHGAGMLARGGQPRPHGSRRPRPADGPRPRGAALPHHPGRRARASPRASWRTLADAPWRRRLRSSCRRCPASGPMRLSSGLPTSMTLKFGEPSFDNHLVAARAAGLRPLVRRLPGLGLDVDAPEDLALLLDRGPSTRSAGLLASLDVPARLARRSRGAVSVPPRYEVIGVEGLPEIGAGDDLARPHRSTPLPRQGHAARGRRSPRDQPEDRLQGRGPHRAASRRSRRPPEHGRHGRGARPRSRG